MSGYGYQRPPITLLDQKLTLNRETQAIIAEIEAQMAAKEWMERLQNPNWVLHVQLFEELTAQTFQPRIDLFPRIAPPIAPVVPGRPLGPMPPPKVPFGTPSTQQPPPPKPFDPFAQPKAGEAKDVLEAVYKLPVVQSLVLRVNEELARQWRVFKLEWKGASTPSNVATISYTAMILSGMLVPIIANKAPREAALQLIKGKDIPVPLVPGLSVKIFDSREEFAPKAAPPGMMTNPNAPAESKVPLPDSVMLMFDVTEFFESRKKK